MRKLSKILLTLTVINAVAAALFLSDIIDVSDVPGLYVAFPFAAVLFCMFLASLAMEKEVPILHDEQTKHRVAPEIESKPAESTRRIKHRKPIEAWSAPHPAAARCKVQF